MKKNLSITTLFIIAFFCFKKVAAQNDTLIKNPVYKIGIFSPLYLDSVFSNNSFKYKQGIPRFILPALDFVQGTQVAMDSMHLKNENIETTIYDSKAFEQNIPWLIQNKKLDSLNLIIGNVKEAEYKQLAEFAIQKKIPFISSTYPNDGGITANPYVVIVNPTLRAHCETIYSYLLQNHGTDKIFLCRQNGKQEDMVAGFFKQINEQDGSTLLKIETLNFEQTVNIDFLKSKLDSNRKNIIVGASLDEIFVIKLTDACFKLQITYPITLIGMPNWDGMPGLHKKESYPNFPIFFTSPYFNNKWDDYSKILISAYTKKYKGKPSDMAFKGFELMYLFTGLLTRYPGNLMDNLNDRSIKIFNEYNFRPVRLKKENEVPDYFENKHLYFIKILKGVVSKAW